MPCRAGGKLFHTAGRVCLSVYARISNTTRPNFTKFSARFLWWPWLSHLWRRCISVSVDDILFSPFRECFVQFARCMDVCRLWLHLICWLQEDDIEEEEEEETEEEAVDRMRTEISENFENDLGIVTSTVVSIGFSLLIVIKCCYYLYFSFKSISFTLVNPMWARGTPFPPLLLFCPFTSSSIVLYYLFLFPFLIHFTYFLLLSIRSLSTRIVPLRFQAWGRRRRPNLGLVCFVLW